MFGLDQWLLHFSDGTTLVIVLAVAVLLGLRHAGDPDHLAAVTTLVTNDRGGATRLGPRLGARPRLLAARLRRADRALGGLPAAAVEQGAEVAIGLVIVALASGCSCAGGGAPSPTPTRI